MTGDSTPAQPRVRYADATPTGLPSDLLQRASKRLGYAALIYAGTYFMAYFGPILFNPRTMWQVLNQSSTPVAAASIGLGLAIYLLSRFGSLRPAILLDIGLVFEVVGAIGIAWANMWGVWPEAGDFSRFIEVLQSRAGYPGYERAKIDRQPVGLIENSQRMIAPTGCFSCANDHKPRTGCPVVDTPSTTVRTAEARYFP